MNTEFRPFCEEFIPDAERLLRLAYEAERKRCAALPEHAQFAAVSQELAFFAENGMGVCAVENGALVAFLCAYPPFAHAFNSRDAGCWSPLHAHAAARPDDSRLWARLYQNAAELWTGAGARFHSITLYRHEETARNVLSGYGFGWRCMDAVRAASPVGAALPQDCSLRALTTDDFPALRPLRRALVAHLSRSPFFQISSDEIVERYIRSKEEDADRLTFGLFRSSRLIGYIDLDEGGENFISDGDGMLNIQGAYLEEAYRGDGLAELLEDKTAASRAVFSRNRPRF